MPGAEVVDADHTELGHAGLGAPGCSVRSGSQILYHDSSKLCSLAPEELAFTMVL